MVIIGWVVDTTIFTLGVMDNMRKAFTLLIVILLTGCSTIDQIVQKPTVTFEGIAIRDISLFEETVVFRIQITNPNQFGIKVENIQYNLKINGNDFVDSSLDRKIQLAGRSTERIEIPVSIRHLDLFQNVVAFIKAKEAVYELNGSVDFGVLDIPFGGDGKISIPQLPKLQLNAIRIRELSWQNTEMELELGLENLNSFAMDLEGMDYSLRLAGKDIVAGNLSQAVRLDQMAETRVLIPIQISFLDMGRSLFLLLNGEEAGYEFRGAFKFNGKGIDELAIPFLDNGEVPFLK